MKFGFAIPTVVLAALSSTAFAGPPKEEHFDIWINIVNSQIRVGAISEDGLETTPGVRVFGAELGEDALFPYSAFEPGFQMHDGTALSNDVFTFNILDPLMAWNGSGFGAASETMEVAFQGNSVESSSGVVPGFNFAADAEGGLHSHFDYTLMGPGATIPADGIYLLSLNLEGATGQYGTSQKFWIVFNLNMDEEMHDMAIDWVQENLVPAPGALSAMLLFGLAGRRRRRS